MDNTAYRLALVLVGSVSLLAAMLFSDDAPRRMRVCIGVVAALLMLFSVGMLVLVLRTCI